MILIWFRLLKVDLQIGVADADKQWYGGYIFSAQVIGFSSFLLGVVMLVMMCFLCVSEEKFDHDPENPFDQIELDDDAKMNPDITIEKIVNDSKITNQVLKRENEVV